MSRYPSLSSSGSRQSGSPSLSLSMGLSALFVGLVPQASSIVSDQLSLSSSVSALSPIPSPSESACSEASNGKLSQTSPYPSASVSTCKGIVYINTIITNITHPILIIISLIRVRYSRAVVRSICYSIIIIVFIKV